MSISIPSKETKKWRGQYLSEFRGNILNAFNIDLEKNEGTVHLSEQTQELLTSDDDAQLGLPEDFILSNADNTNRYWALTSTGLFKSNAGDPEAGWAQDAIASSPTDSQDRFQEFVDDLYVASSTDIDKLSGGTWTNPWWSAQGGASALTASVYHGMTISPIAELLIADGRFINSWDGVTATDPRITLPSQYEITDMVTEGDFTIITTKTTDSTEANVFHWDGTSETYNNYYPAGTNDIKKIFIADGIAHVITKKGQIRRFTGSAYAELRVDEDVVVGFPLGARVNISVGGVGPLDGKIGITVFGSNASENEFHGIWLFDPVTLNLYPKYALSLSPTESNQLGGYPRLNNIGGYLETAVGAGKFLVGGSLPDTASTSKLAICSSKENSTSGQRTYIITPKIPTSFVKDFWKRLTVIFQKFEDSGDRIIVKYKVEDKVNSPLIKSLTWVDTTHVDLASITGVAVGDEMFITRGPFPSFSTSVSAIDTLRLTLVDAAPAASTDTGDGLFENWTALGEISDTTIQSEIMNIRKRSTFIQFKIELRGTETSPEFQELLIDNIPKSV